VREVRDGLQGEHSRLLDLYRLAAHGQPVGAEHYRALLFTWHLLGEPLSVWHGFARIASSLTSELETWRSAYATD
jgi:hypothetical protein